MPIITAINLQEKDKNRCNIYVDNEFFKGVSIEMVLKNSLKVGLEVDENKLNMLIQDSELTDALNKAVFYVSKALKTKRQVKDYLLKKGYSNDIVWKCIDKLKEYDLINDTQYSKRYIETMSKNQGKKLIEYKLMSKGIKKEDIYNAYETAEVSHVENAKLLAEKYMKNKEKTKENYAKVYKYLLSRGYSYDEVSEATSIFKDFD